MDIVRFDAGQFNLDLHRIPGLVDIDQRLPELIGRHGRLHEAPQPFIGSAKVLLHLAHQLFVVFVHDPALSAARGLPV